jgi:hypothetical protein
MIQWKPFLNSHFFPKLKVLNVRLIKNLLLLIICYKYKSGVDIWIKFAVLILKYFLDEKIGVYCKNEIFSNIQYNLKYL